MNLASRRESHGLFLLFICIFSMNIIVDTFAFQNRARGDDARELLNSRSWQRVSFPRVQSGPISSSKKTCGLNKANFLMTFNRPENYHIGAFKEAQSLGMHTRWIRNAAIFVLSWCLWCTSNSLPAIAETVTTTSIVEDHHVAYRTTHPPTPTSSIILSLTKTPAYTPEDVIDEAWTLIQKYSIDKTYNGQDWMKIRTEYTRMARKIPRASGDTDGALLKLLESMVNRLGDRYTRILDPAAYSAIQKYDLIGVGVTLMPNEQKQIIVGAPPIPNSAADRAGLQVGDQVLAINGVTTQGRTAFDIIDQIGENPSAQTITMTIRKKDDVKLRGSGVDNRSATVDIVMEREFRAVKNPIQYKIAERRKDGTVVGYIRITEFNALVKAKLQDALIQLRTQGANAYVLDLRHNAGGAFQSAVEISSLFLPDRIATYVVDNASALLPFKTPSDKVLVDPNDPLVIWMDNKSASASEVLAGSLHDNCRAILMGEKSFGKGLIQAVYGLKNGAGLVLTVARYVTPAGTEIQGIGISPDFGKEALPLYLPGLPSSDTSKVDFRDIRVRQGMCQQPVPL